MLEIAESVFNRLGLKLQADLSDSFASEARSYQVQDLRGRGVTGTLMLKVYEKDAAGAGSSAGIWDTGRWSTRSADQWSTAAHPKSGGQEKSAAGPAKIQNLQMNWLVSEQADHHFFPRILEVGEIDGLPFLLREYLPQSLTTLARTRVVPNPAMLHQIVSGAWTALCFLHQPEVNMPHGNLKLSNVLIGKGPIQEAEVFLSDAIETPETARKVRKQDDFRALGLILYQIVTSDPAPISFVEALVRADGADWSGLGNKEGAAWKQLAVRLLDEASYQDFNAVAARQSWLDPVRPKKARLIEIPLPLPAAPAGPTLGGDARAKPPQEIAADLDAMIQGGDLLGALRTAAKALAGMNPPDPDLFGRLDYCAAHLSAEAISHSDTLLVLEEAANLGSAPAASRLGHALLNVDADEALSWLKTAADRGATDALGPLCRLLETGTPSHPAEPAQALACMEKLREIQPGEGTDYLFAAMILRGKTGRPASEAVALLTSLHERGHYRSSDLLAQCHATGTGTDINEKRAYNLFVEAWGRSKATNEHYYTASNNLGVCFALGFGVSRDTESAKHYFRQGALKQHQPSEENLERLKQVAG